MKSILITSAFFLLFHHICISQKIDSLYKLVQRAKSDSAKAKALGDLAYSISSNDPDSALKLGWQGVSLAKKSNSNAALANCLQAIGWSYFRLGKNDSAIIFITQAKNIFHQLKMLWDEGSCLKNMGSVYSSSNDYTKAFACLMPAKALFEKLKDEKYEAYVDKQIGGIYRLQGVLGLAKQYLSSAIATFERLHENGYLGDAFSAYGSVFWAEKNYDSALYFYRKEYQIYSGVSNISNQAYAAENIGTAFYSKCEEKNGRVWADSALLYFEKALGYFEKVADSTDVNYEKINIGAALHLKNDYKAAAKNLTEALSFFSRANNIAQVYQVYYELSKVYRDQGDYKIAYALLDSASVYNDTLTSRNNASTIAGMFAKYEADKKDRTILLLNTQQKLSEQELSRQHIITIFIISLAFFGIFLVFILWNRNRIKQKLKEVQVRNQLSNDLHDDIGSSLSSILLLSNLVGQQKNDESVNKTLLEKIANNTKEVIDKMSDIVWTMNPKYDEGESLRERIENYVVRLKEVTTVTINGNIDGKIDQYHFTMELRKNIFLIIKEAMNNALKYANASLLQLDFIAGEKYFQILIKDNGIGFDKAVTVTGNGFETMIHRAKASNGECTITSECGKGTLVKTIIPIPNIR